MKTLFIPIGIWLVIHLFKYLRRSLARKNFTWANFAEHGGMPSSHAVFSTSLSTMVGLQSGWASPLFAASAVFTIIICHDAFRIRMIIEHQSKILNRLRQGLPERERALFGELEENVGHTFLEVAVGVATGALLTLLLNALVP